MSPHALLDPALRATSRVLAVLGLLLALAAGLLVAPPSADAASITGSRVVAEARKHKGKPYRYGATGPSRFDCSGYVQYVYKRVGKRLPRTSRAQYAATRRISKSSKRTGDLIFIRTSGRITHVGIYAGGGKFWVAPRTGSHVKLQRIYTSSYSVGRVR